MPVDYGAYPPNWKQIRREILDRAGDRCEGSPQYPDCRAQNHRPHPVTESKVVLTVAHVDHDRQNCGRENLKAWCQRCHLAHDKKQHARNAAQTRRDRRARADLFPL